MVVFNSGQGVRNDAAASVPQPTRPQRFRTRRRRRESVNSALADNAPEFIMARRKAFGAGKRIFDFTASVLILVLLTPLLALTALAVRLDSPGPVFYRQRRVGAGGRVFDMYKFRSMRLDAEKDGPRWAEPGDARATRVGRVLRKTRLDEVPQIINVLQGDMSLVGPRPERPEFVSLLEREIPGYQRRHIVKPGITGWAQVRYAYAASVDDARVKLVYDLEYISTMALWRDFLIILMTVKVVLFGVGSR